MSIFLDKLRKTPKYKGEIIKYHERFVEILEEMGLEEKENDGIITYSYKGDVWISVKISSINIYMETPILEKLTSYNQNNPLLCFAKSYDYLVRKCRGTSAIRYSFLSLAFLLSSYMTHITHGTFKSKLINWDE